MWTPDPELSVEGVGLATAPAAPTRPRRTRAGTALGWVRQRLTTTPGRLVLISGLVVVGAVCFGVIATSAEQSREHAVRAARTSTEPLLVHAVNLYTSLSDANATVATGLLAGGVETTAKRARYLRDLRLASESLTALTREAGTSPSAAPALQTVANQLPVYSGLVETARANNRQGFPIGAAYLRQAAGLMTGTMLPAAGQIYRTAAQRLDAGYRTGTSTASLVALIAAALVALVLLLLAQRWIERMSRRILNILMVLGTVALLAVSAWAVIGLASEQNALTSAQRHGSDSVELLSAANVLLSRAQGDLSLALVNRGTDQTDPQDFARVKQALTSTGLANRVGSGFPAYLALAKRVQDLENGGQLQPAITLAPRAGDISDSLGHGLQTRIAAAQNRFETSAADASSALSGLGLAIPLLTALAAALVLLGLRQRINEYR
jgi:hypothetical protein